MKPDTRTVRELFELDVRYLVPLYQRSYVWDAESQWEPLWEDIQTILEHRLNGGGEFLSHFLGAIVLEQELQAPGAIPRFTIIDGQQRLTTLQIVIAAARNVAVEFHVDREAAILGRLTANDELTANGIEMLKVWPTNANRAAFGAVMKNGGPPSDRDDDPNNRIDEAYAFFCKAIREWLEDAGDSDERSERLKTLRITISDLLKVVSIILEPGENAQIIFETLNARGTPLLALDLVKNAVFHAAEKQGLDTDALYHDVWEPELDQNYWRTERRQGRLYRPRADLFLMHWLTMRLHEVVPANELFARFRQRILGVPEPPRADDLIRELRRDARIMRTFDEQPTGSLEANFFERLGLLDTTVVLPVVLFLFREKVISTERRRRALWILESWLARRSLMRLTVKNYNEQVPAILERLSKDPQQADDVLLSHLRSGQGDVSRWPADEELTGYLTTRSVYGHVGTKKLVMALAAVEESLYTSKVDLPTIPKKLSVEHVLPQDWEKHWPLTGADDVVEQRKVREEHIHRLGNLTLTAAALNTALSNSAWSKKRDALNKYARLLLNVELIESHPEVFDEHSIDERSVWLSQRICKIWPGPNAWGNGSHGAEGEAALTSRSISSERGRASEIAVSTAVADAGTGATRGKGETLDALSAFWSEFLERDQGRTRGGEAGRAKDLRGARFTRRHLLASGGKRGLFFRYGVSEDRASVDFYIDLRSGEANARIFDGLFAKRAEVESAFGGPLDWKTIEGTRARRIECRFPSGGYGDRSSWPEIQEEMIDTMIRLQRALRPHIDVVSG